MVEFSKPDEVKRWLDTIEPAERRREVAVALAARAALRVLPFTGHGLRVPESKRISIPRARVFREIVLPSFGATALAWIAAQHPSGASELFANCAPVAARRAEDAIGATLAAPRSASGAATAAAFAADTVHVLETSGHAAQAFDSALDAVNAHWTTFAQTAVAATEMTAALEADANAVTSGRSATEVARAPLWPNGAPGWATDAWRTLKSALLAANENWDVWTDWYEARLAGDAAHPPNEALEVARATIADEIWRQGPAAVNAEVKRLIDKFDALEDEPPQRLGDRSVDVRDAGGLMAWIDDQDASKKRDFAIVIATRSALRAVPTLSALFLEPSFTNPSPTVLSSLRALSLPWASIRHIAPGDGLAIADAAANDVASFSTARDESGLRLVPAVAAAFAVTDAYVFVLRASAKRDSGGRTAFRSFIASASRAADLAVRAYMSVGMKDTAALWVAVSADANALASGRSPFDLSQDPLWPAPGAPYLATARWATLMTMLKEANQDWDVWFRWYQRRIEGAALRASDDVERAYIEVPLPLWDEGPAQVNRWIKNRIAELATPPYPRGRWDFFVSYAKEDERSAREVVGILEGSGYSTVAQFKDFPVGANFVNEMNNGLAGMGRFVALYSPRYQASEHCQAEWNAAYNSDPSGAKRKLVAFLLKPTALTPLARQIVYRSLVGLTKAQRKRAILESIGPQPLKRSGEAVKRALAEVASPQASINAKQQLDAGPNATFDRPFVDADLPELPSVQRGLADAICKSLPRNAPPIAGSALEHYRDHLLERGTQPIVRYLDDLSAALRAECEASEADDWKGQGLATLFERFFANDALLRTHFPLKGEEVYAELPIDEDKATGDLLTDPIKEVAAAMHNVVAVDKATPAIAKAVDSSAAFARDLASLPPPQIPPDANSRRVTVKRRYVLGTIGFLVTIYGLIGTTASIYGVPAGQALFTAVADAIEKLMSLLL